MEAVGAEYFAAYQARLEADPGEFEGLLNTILINVTSFFRDAEAWEVLKARVAPLLIARAEADRPIRPLKAHKIAAAIGPLLERT